MSRGARAGRERPRWARITLRVARWGLLLGLLSAVAGVGTLAAMFAVYGADADLPDVARLKRFRPKQVTRVLAADGKTLIGEIYEERRTRVPYERFPKVLVDAVVCAEDARFFEHEGLNVWGMVRAFFVNLRAGHYRQGGSTITQQVVKTFFLSPKRTLRRKVQEVILARRLEQTLNKQQILELYLNQIYLGHLRYGVQEAARFYFGKDVDHLGLAEAAMLAGLPQSPERLSPLRHPARARARRRYVLTQMVKHHKVSRAAADAADRAPLPTRGHGIAPDHPCAEFVTGVRRRLVERFGKKALPTLGLTVITTCDPRLQRQARKALEAGLRALDKRQHVMRPGRPLSGRALRRTLASLSRRQPARPVPGRIYQAVVTRLDDAARKATVSLGKATGVLHLDAEPRYNPRKRAPSQLLRRHALLHVRPVAAPRKAGEPIPLRLAQGPEGAVVVLDVATREVRAMVGGYGQRVGQFNRALEAVRQPGSTFKPIVYAAALEDKKITAATTLPDAPHPCENWLRIRRRGHKSYLGQVTVRTALARSLNSVACRVYEREGNARVRALARQLGIRSPLTEHLSLALGASGIRPIELAGVFATFAGAGRYLPPRLLRRLGDRPVEQPAAVQVISPETAFLVTSLLTSVVRRGTAWRARRLGRRAAGKTGTSNQNRDAWFAGYTPQLVTVVWVGHDDFRPLGPREHGGRAAVPIWTAIMKRALAGAPKRWFRPPPTLEVRTVDPKTGEAVPPSQPNARKEFFLPGTAPEPAAVPQVDSGDLVIQDGDN